MEAAKKARTSARAWVTRQGNKVLEIVNGKTVTKATYFVELEDFHKRVATLERAQSDYEAFLTPEQFEEDIEQTDIYHSEHVKAVLAATRQLPMAGDDDDEQDNDRFGSHISHTSQVAEAKLPKLSLPKFGGEIQEWMPFWEQFDAVIDKRDDLPIVTKFSYLRDTLFGEAKRAIAGLSLTGANYQAACDILKERFGRKNKIIFAHVQALLGVAVPDRPSVEALWQLYSDLQTHIRSLDSLGITGQQYGVILTPLILSRLPAHLRLEWAREGERAAEARVQTTAERKQTTAGVSHTPQLDSWEADLAFLMDFLKREIQRRETSQTYSEDGQLDAPPPPPPPSAASLHVASTSGRPSTSGRSPSGCGLCYKERHSHSTFECPSLATLSIPQKKERLFAAMICMKCLAKSTPTAPHDFGSCKSKCAHCKGPHNAILCMKKSQSGKHTHSHSKSNSDLSVSSYDSVNQASAVTMTSTSASNHQNVLLQTIKVSVSGRSGKCRNILALFDSGSDRTYVSQNLVDSVDPEWVESNMLSCAAFGEENKPVAKKREVYNLLLKGEEGAYTLNATCVPTICTPLSRPSVPPALLKMLPTSQLISPPAGHDLKIDVLIGMDSYWKLIGSEIVSLADGLVAHHTRLGWMVSGMLPTSESSIYPQSGAHCDVIDTGGTVA